MREGIGTEITKSELESSIGTVDDDFDGDQSIRADRARMCVVRMRSGHDW